MLSILKRIFIKEDSMSESEIRHRYGVICSVFGIFLNILLFGIKYFAGIFSGSISIIADAFNNLSDIGSSLITLLGFKLASKKPDPDHPFGHGRMEYLSGLAVSSIIIVVGFELARTSLDSIIHPHEVNFGLIPIIILVVSVCVKFYMFFYNMVIGKKINSSGMKATALDSLSDSLSTSVVLVCLFINHFVGMNIDGFCGMLVAIFILYAGVSSAKGTLDQLMGKAAKKEDVEKIEKIVLSYDDVKGVHDLIVHDYGPGRVMISLHAEVNGEGDIFKIHDTIDTIEKDLKEKLNCEAIIHMDPIEENNERVTIMRDEVLKLVKQINEDNTIHDFRLVPGPTHTNLIFDVVVPHKIEMSDSQIKEKISELIIKKWDNHYSIIEIDRPYVKA